MIAPLLFIGVLVCSSLYHLVRARRLELHAARLRADLAAQDESAAAGLSAGNEIIAALEAERDVARADLASERRARAACLAEIADLRRRLGPHCASCGNAINLDVCQCGSPVHGHANEGHTIVPMGCACHLDHQPDWQRIAETRHRLCAIAHLRALRAEDDAAIALSWREKLVRIGQDLRDQRDALSAEIGRVYLAAGGIGACRVLAAAKVASQAATLEQSAVERARLIAERDAYAVRVAELERQTAAYVGATPCLELTGGAR